MAGKRTETNGQFSGEALDAYGIWVQKSPASESEGFSDLPMVEGKETSEEYPAIPADNDPGSTEADPDSGDYSSRQDNEGQEAMLMSDKDNNVDKLADAPEATDITFDDSEEIIIPGTDDLSDLSDLLMSIDEETSGEETVYLEDEDMSLDLDDGSDDLLLDADLGDSPLSEEDSDEEIIIPGLEDLDLDGDLDVDSLEIPGLDLPDTDSQESMAAIPSDDTDLPSMEDDFEISIPDADETTLDLPEPDDFAAVPTGEVSLSASEEDDLLSLDNTPVEEDMLSVDLDEDAFSLDDMEGDTPVSLDDEEGLSLSLDESENDNIFLDTKAFVTETTSTPGDDVFDEPPSFGEDAILENDLMEEELSGDEDLADTAGSDSAPLSAPGEVPEYTVDLTVPDVRDEFPAGTDKPFEEPAYASEPASSASAPRTGGESILRSIEDELHAIRSELVDLRSELKRLRAKDTAVIPEEEPAGFSPDLSSIDESQPEVADDSNLVPSEERSSGFFDDDEDETIALTGDELDNILNSAEFIEEEGEPTVMEDSEEDILLDTEAPSGTELPSDIGSDSYEESPDGDSFAPIEEIELESMNVLGEEPSRDTPENTAKAPEDIVSPSEVSEDDDTVLAAANLDIEKELEGIEGLSDEEDDFEIFTGDELADITIDIPEPLAEPESILEPDLQLDETIDSDISDELILEDEEPGLPAEEESPVAPVDTPEMDNEFEEDTATGIPVDAPEDQVTSSLRNEIKAVLSYMDKLLESLPEEKIEEFARSEHFEVYKKLFDELGI